MVPPTVQHFRGANTLKYPKASAAALSSVVNSNVPDEINISS